MERVDGPPVKPALESLGSVGDSLDIVASAFGTSLKFQRQPRASIDLKLSSQYQAMRPVNFHYAPPVDPVADAQTLWIAAASEPWASHELVQ